MHWPNVREGAVSIKNREEEQKKRIRKNDIMDQTLTTPETFLGVGYTKHRAGLPLEAVRVPVPQPGADQVLIRVAASSLNPLEYKLAELNFLGRTPPVVLGLDLSGFVVAKGSAVRGLAVGDAVARITFSITSATTLPPKSRS
jgi:NADPH-dependent curcumin reductase CurA